jgi:hypothetical protein
LSTSSSPREFELSTDEIVIGARRRGDSQGISLLERGERRQCDHNPVSFHNLSPPADDLAADNDRRAEGIAGNDSRPAGEVGEYRRRGPLLQGATLAAGISTVMANPVESKVSDSLPWLDPTNLDDRLLASIIEVMRLNVRASVIVVTRDVNFQNKLEFARVPFVSPEDLGIEENR